MPSRAAPGVWLIGRASPEARALAAKLARRGVKAVPLACTQQVEGEALLPAFRALPAQTVVFVTSAAAAALVRALPLGPRVRVAAVAPSTARALGALGVTVHLRSEGGALALAAAVRHAWAGKGYAVLYPTSAQGLAREEQAQALALLSHVGPVTRVAAYRTLPARGLAGRLERALRLRGPKLFLASPSSVEAVRAAVAPARLRRLTQVLCLGQSTAQAWEFQRAKGVVSATLAPRGLTALEAVLTAAAPLRSPRR